MIPRRKVGCRVPRRVSANGNGGRICLTCKAFNNIHRGEGDGYLANGHLICRLAGVSGTLEDCWDLAGTLNTESGKADQMGDPWWLRYTTQSGGCLFQSWFLTVP